MVDSLKSVSIHGEKNEYGSGQTTEFSDVEFLVLSLDSGDHHIWVDGIHYETVGTAETVSEGDLFYWRLPQKEVWKVVNVDESVPTSEPGVEAEILYPGGSSTISVDVLTGLPFDKRPMGSTGPPELLEQRPL